MVAILADKNGQSVYSYNWIKKVKCVTVESEEAVKVDEVHVDQAVLLQRLSNARREYPDTTDELTYKIPTSLFKSSHAFRSANKPSLADVIRQSIHVMFGRVKISVLQ